MGLVGDDGLVRERRIISARPSAHNPQAMARSSIKTLLFWKKWLRPGDARVPVPADLQKGGLLTGDATLDEHSLTVLLDSIAEVNSTMDLDRVLGDIVDKSLEVTQAERAILFLGKAADDLEIRVARDRDGADLGRELLYSRSVVRRAMIDGQATRSIVQSDQEALELGQSVFDLKLRAVMCAPLQAKERIVGAIYVDSRAARREFSARDLALFGALSAQLAIAIVNAQWHADSLQMARLERDVEIARRIQRHLLAPVPGSVAGVDLALRYHPAEGASGDSYDIMPLENGKLALLIGDVTGHGIGAALLAHAAQAAVRSYVELIDDLGEVIRRLNNRLCASVESGNFMSLVLALIDPRQRTLHYVNAGHPAMLLATAQGVRELEKSGMVLGVVADAPLPVRGPVALAPGDVLLLRTDGVEETMGPGKELFGDERLAQVLGAARAGSAEDVLARVERALREFSGGAPAQDDLTMIALRMQDR
jgi:serine phosphatase RsbU (regulator of sigma subunit)